jgi:hypothetical protein
MDWTAITQQANELYGRLVQLQAEYATFWRSNVLLTWRWWLDLAIIIIPWVIWIIVRKKKSTDRLLYAGLVVMMFACYMDMVGVSMGLWTYPASAVPLMPEYIPFDISSLPVTTMLFIQFLPKLKPIYKAVIYAAIGSFVYEPFMHWVGLYDRLAWEYWYTFPILVAVYLAANFFATRDRFQPVT